VPGSLFNFLKNFAGKWLQMYSTTFSLSLSLSVQVHSNLFSFSSCIRLSFQMNWCIYSKVLLMVKAKHSNCSIVLFVFVCGFQLHIKWNWKPFAAPKQICTYKLTRIGILLVLMYKESGFLFGVFIVLLLLPTLICFYNSF